MRQNMMHTSVRPAFGVAAYYLSLLALGGSFVFAAIQGDYGVFRQVEIAAETQELQAEKDRLASELGMLSNLTRRLSDAYLDLDLLDQQARDVLGFLRADEIVIR
jgi:cell division protein FtsB